MSANKMSQKEYLKKYLSGDINKSEKVKKKKKKDKSSTKPSVHIVDDDIDLSQLAHATEEDLDNYNLGEDLPQIAAIIDERPAELIAKEDYKASAKWKTMGEDDTMAAKNNVGEQTSGNKSSQRSMDSSPPRKYKRESDASPPRRSKRSPDASLPRRLKREPDASPPRRSKRSPDSSPPRKYKRESDASPPRRSKHSPDYSPRRRSKRSPDTSPPRRLKKDPDASPPRRSKRSSDASPPRRLKRESDASPPRRSKRSPDASPPRRSKRSSDASPPRRPKREPDVSPPRRSRRSPDASVPRRSRQSPGSSSPRRFKRDPDASPPRRSKRSPDPSPRRRSNRTPEASPPRPSHSSKRNVSDSPPPTHKKMNKTLEGKLAGLQDATALREENEKFRKREDDMFKKMAEKQRYGDSNTVRDRKTGRRANKPEDVEKQREKLKKEEERKQVYDVWGRGLKQIEEYKSRVATETHEMNKPVARYANDEDLDEYLRTQCRDGDPMAEHFRKKRNEAQSGPSKPVYQGSFPENRFNIRPGYRWDGVDRSNGYEKKWFDVLNQKKASEEEAYKYSVEDM